MAPTNTINSLLAKVEQVTESGCWIFMGYTKPTGYAQASFQGVTKTIHNLFYKHFIGHIPANLVPDHLCRVRCCVNPWHLDIVTNRTNTLRGQGPSAINAMKAHCKCGLPYDRVVPVDTGTYQYQQRVCSACKLKRERERRLKNNLTRPSSRQQSEAVKP